MTKLSDWLRHWVCKLYWTTIYIEIYVELYCSSTRGDCNDLLTSVWPLMYIKKSDILLFFSIIIVPSSFMIIVNEKKAITFSQQALFIVRVFIECLLHCLLNSRYAFFEVIICVYTSWKTVVLPIGKTALYFLFHVLDLNDIFANQDPSHFNFSSRGQAEWTPVEASCYTGCLKKMVIELWRAIGHSIFNIQE